MGRFKSENFGNSYHFAKIKKVRKSQGRWKNFIKMNWTIIKYKSKKNPSAKKAEGLQNNNY